MEAEAKVAPEADNYLQLMRGRVGVLDGSSIRGYWLVSPSATLTPPCMCAGEGGTVVTEAYNLSDAAKRQRWLILTQAAMADFEHAAKDAYIAELDKIIGRIRQLRDVPHIEDVAGTDRTLNDRLANIEARKAAATGVAEVTGLVEEARRAGFDFLANATPSDNERPFDLTFMIVNQGMDAANGWSATPALAYSAAEFYEKTFDFHQTVKLLPAGCYRLKAQAFQRPGSSTDVYNNYTTGNEAVTTYIYAGDKSAKVCHAVAGAQSQPVGIGRESTLPSSPASYIPNDMQSAAAYFAKGLYENEVFTDLTADGSDLRIGIRCSSSAGMYWSIFDNFRLHYYGNQTSDVVAGIAILPPTSVGKTNDVYNLNGLLVRKHAKNLNGLSKGIYVVDGKKVVVRYSDESFRDRKRILFGTSLYNNVEAE